MSRARRPPAPASARSETTGRFRAYLRQTKTGRLVLHRDKIAEQRRRVTQTTELTARQRQLHTQLGVPNRRASGVSPPTETPISA